MTGPYLLGIGTTWLEVENVEIGATMSRARPTSTFVSLGGKQRVQKAVDGPRTWSMTLDFSNAKTVRWLQAAAQGMAGDVYLLDVTGAQANMLDGRVTAGTDTAQPLVAVDGVSLRSFAVVSILDHKVRGSILHTLSGWTTHTAAAVIATYNIGAGAVNIVAPAGSGARRWTTTFTPGADTSLNVTCSVAGKTSGLRLVEGADDANGWIAGQNTPCQVSVVDPGESLQWMSATRLTDIDYSVTLMEVG